LFFKNILPLSFNSSIESGLVPGGFGGGANFVVASFRKRELLALIGNGADVGAAATAVAFLAAESVGLSVALFVVVSVILERDGGGGGGGRGAFFIELSGTSGVLLVFVCERSVTRCIAGFDATATTSFRANFEFKLVSKDFVGGGTAAAAAAEGGGKGGASASIFFGMNGAFFRIARRTG